MISIEEHKARRRERLAELLREIKPVELVDLLHAQGTPMSAAMLYQMSRGTGKSMRHSNDTQARNIERAAGKPRGWLDGVSVYRTPPVLHAREPADDDQRSSSPLSSKLTSKQLLLRQTFESFLPIMSDQQAEALRQMILAMRGSSAAV